MSFLLSIKRSSDLEIIGPTMTDVDPVKRSSTERYSRVAANLDWVIVLGASSSIFFGFLLNITVNPLSYFQFSDNMILLPVL